MSAASDAAERAAQSAEFEQMGLGPLKLFWFFIEMDGTQHAEGAVWATSRDFAIEEYARRKFTTPEKLTERAVIDRRLTHQERAAVAVYVEDYGPPT